jgi:hypothetical protein|uniref:Uncharacterized protein n=1 Tax=Siphoviridae sp. ctnR613 TaxID=2827939 RepID=A0A8S5SP10_9CAUD|nr:MAG TPA: hypothetical protein [Siphoviridae sp. ctnR613]
MKIATYDNLNNYTSKHNSYVDYSRQNETKTKKTTTYIARYEKSENKALQSEIEELKFRNKILTVAFIGVTFMALLV